MDSLSMDAKAAREAGMSYGAWKAIHPETKKDNEASAVRKATPLKNNAVLYTTTCRYCGRAFETDNKQRKYCDDVCKNAQNGETYRRRHKKPSAALEGEVEICPV